MSDPNRGGGAGKFIRYEGADICDKAKENPEKKAFPG